MKTAWFQHLPRGEAQDTFKTSVASAAHVLERLADILCERIEANAKSSTEDYDSPAWPYRQADKVGYDRALREILDLTKINPQRSVQ